MRRKETAVKKLYIPLAVLALAAAALAQGVSTRFGKLDVNSEKILTFKGRPVNPVVQGNDSLSLLDKFSIGATDVVLIRVDGGTACPALYHFVTVSATGAKATKFFGTCSDQAEAARKGDAITLTMPGFEGPFESAAKQVKAEKERHVFVFRNGAVTENGKPVP
jgi:hypothetical protein